jgi:hypothetical protein
MTLSISARRKAAWILVLLAVLLVIAGCAGIQPYKPRNHREEGPERGLASGSEGEFVIYERAGETEKDTKKKDAKDKKDPNEAERAVKPKVDGNHNGKVEMPPPGDTP